MSVDLFQNQAQPVDLFAGTNHAPASASPTTQVPGQQVSAQTPGPSIIDKVKPYATAAFAGLMNAGANIGEGLADTPVLLLNPVMQHLRLWSPKTADSIMKDNKEVFNLARSSETGDQSDILNKAYTENPMTGKGAELVGNIAGLVTGMKTVPTSIGQGLSSLFRGVPETAGVVGRALGQGLVGQAAAEPEMKGKSFALNSLLSPVADVVGMGLKAFGKTAEGLSQINNTLSTLTPDKVNKAYQVVKDMPFSEANKAQTTTLSQNVTDLVSKFDGILSPKQTRLLTNMSTQLENVTSHSDSLKLMQNIGAETKNFSGLKASDELFNTFKGIKDTLKNNINQSAIQNEVPNALDIATSLNKTSNILAGDKGIFTEMNANPNFNFSTASKKLNLAIEKYQDIPYMQDTVDVLKGLQKTTASLGRSYKMSGFEVHGLGAAAGAGVGYEEGGSPSSAILGGALGGLTAPILVHQLRTFAMSPIGRQTMQYLGKTGTPTSDTTAVIRSIVAGGLAGNLNKSTRD